MPAGSGGSVSQVVGGGVFRTIFAGSNANNSLPVFPSSTAVKYKVLPKRVYKVGRLLPLGLMSTALTVPDVVPSLCHNSVSPRRVAMKNRVLPIAVRKDGTLEL